ncbi:uncharacterized protein PSFLO_01376 [Pseudozyma flocculosa]|uniref:Uncharacterized protein n=1 Tax=Pseudozyma flocculosa TaxID=84751 RepID=A0A5C3EVY1_9BASI|nr:uncharacterized protein PSFLO_01376 [Pseudozyma flocculosa]
MAACRPCLRGRMDAWGRALPAACPSQTTTGRTLGQQGSPLVTLVFGLLLLLQSSPPAPLARVLPSPTTSPPSSTGCRTAAPAWHRRSPLPTSVGRSSFKASCRPPRTGNITSIPILRYRPPAPLHLFKGLVLQLRPHAALLGSSTTLRIRS